MNETQILPKCFSGNPSKHSSKASEKESRTILTNHRWKAGKIMLLPSPVKPLASPERPWKVATNEIHESISVVQGDPEKVGAWVVGYN